MRLNAFRYLLPVVFITAAALTAQAREEVRFKDGRQFALDLGRRLKIEDSELNRVIKENRTNLPRLGTASALNSTMAALAKVASEICTLAHYFEKNRGKIEDLYAQIFDRAPTPDEKNRAIKTADGKFSYFANCFRISLSPEFILLPKSEAP
jgi:hypothetical protein